MFIKLLITTILIVGLIVLSLSLKYLFHTESGLKSPSCGVLNGDSSAVKEACASCAIKELASGQ